MESLSVSSVFPVEQYTVWAWIMLRNTSLQVVRVQLQWELHIELCIAGVRSNRLGTDIGPTKVAGPCGPARWADAERYSRSPPFSWKIPDFHMLRLWRYKSSGFALFRVPPQRHQPELLFCHCTMIKSLWESSSLRLSRETWGAAGKESWSDWVRVGWVWSQTGHPSAHWATHCKVTSAPAHVVWVCLPDWFLDGQTGNFP